MALSSQERAQLTQARAGIVEQLDELRVRSNPQGRGIAWPPDYRSVVAKLKNELNEIDALLGNGEERAVQIDTRRRDAPFAIGSGMIPIQLILLVLLYFTFQVFNYDYRILIFLALAVTCALLLTRWKNELRGSSPFWKFATATVLLLILGVVILGALAGPAGH